MTLSADCQFAAATDTVSVCSMWFGVCLCMDRAADVEDIGQGDGNWNATSNVVDEIGQRAF